MKNGSFSLFGRDVKENGYNFLFEPTKIHSSNGEKKVKRKLFLNIYYHFVHILRVNFFFLTIFYPLYQVLQREKLKQFLSL